MKEVQAIKERRESIHKSERYIQDLEIRNSSFLKGFKWMDLYLLLDKDISLLTFSNLRSLSKRDLLAIYDNKVVIPDKSYMYRKYIKKPMSWILFIGFWTIAIAYIYFIFTQGIHAIANLVLFILLIVFELMNLYYFDSFLSVNLIKKSDDISDSKILISQNFDKDLEQYKLFKLQHYRNRKIHHS